VVVLSVSIFVDGLRIFNAFTIDVVNEPIVVIDPDKTFWICLEIDAVVVTVADIVLVISLIEEILATVVTVADSVLSTNVVSTAGPCA
jgi:hypothetical protein